MSENLYTLPQGWAWKKLGDIVDFQGGSQPPKNDFIDECLEGYVRLIQIRDYKTDNHIVYVKKDAVRKFCNENDIMIGRYGPPVFQILRGIKGAYNVALMKACFDENILVNNYLYYYLQNSTIQNYIIGLSQRSAGQSGVNKEALENYDFPLPPLEEQRRIVGVLDGLFGKIDKSIALLDESIASASSLMPSALNEVFDELGEKWEKKKFEDIAFIKGGKRVPKGKKLTEQKTEYPYIRVSDFTDNGTIDISRLQYITKDIYDEIKNYTITCEDLYISIAGTIGKTGIIPKELNGANLTENAAKFVYKIDLVNKYVYYFTLSSIFQEQAGFATKIVAMPKLALTRLSKIEIPLPPLDIQTQTVAYLDALHVKADALKKAQEKKKEELLALKASLLESAFKGEL